MKVLLVGTGGVAGWPEPFCGCASCRSCRETRQHRGRTAALLDDVLLLDWAPEAAGATARAGHSLAEVRYVLMSSPDPSLADSLARLRTSGAGPVRVVLPRQVLASLGDARPVAGPLELVDVDAGEQVRLDPYQVRVLGAAFGGLLYDITGPDGGRVLYAAAPGPLPPATVTAVRDASYDLVVLDESIGGRREAFPHVVAALRKSGAVTTSTDVVAVGLSHRSPPLVELSRQLDAWRVRVVPDGTLLNVRRRTATGAVPGWGVRGRTLVLGGVRSGKSAHAEQLLAAHPRVTYVAPGGTRAGDREWAERVALHRQRRPTGWRTVETSDLVGCLADSEHPVLIDCLGTWLTQRLEHHGVWEGAPASRIDSDVEALVVAWRAARGTVVAVSNEVGSGIVPATASGRLFRDLLGRLNARTAAESETVLLTVAGLVITLRGGDPSASPR